MRRSADCSRIQDFGPRELGILAMVGGPASDHCRKENKLVVRILRRTASSHCCDFLWGNTKFAGGVCSTEGHGEEQPRRWAPFCRLVA